MKKGLEILESRNLADEISFTSLELSLGIKVPPLLKIFHESFVIPKDIGTKYYQNPSGKLRPFISLKYQGYQKEYLGINEIVNFETLLKTPIAYQDYNKYDKIDGDLNNFYEYQLLPICNCELYNRHGGGIGIGTTGSDIDKVILLRHEADTNKEVIAENVFELMRGIKEFLAWDVDLNKLCKSYNQEYWRLEDAVDNTL